MAFPALWQTQLVPASFRGVPFKVEDGGRTAGRRVVEFEFPKGNTPYAEDMGRSARKWQITGYVIGDDYIAQRDALLDACDEDGAGILIHPSLGAMNVMCGPVASHESRLRGGICTFEMLFVEAGQAPSAAVTDDTQGLVSGQADDTGTAAASALDLALAAAFAAGATVANIAEGVGLLGTILNTLSGSVSGQTGTAGTDLFFAINDLLVAGEADLRISQLGTPLLAVFEQATTAGATLAGMNTVIAAMQAAIPVAPPAIALVMAVSWTLTSTTIPTVTPLSAIGIAVVNAGINMALVEQARILAATTFTSSNDVSAAIASNNDNFSSAEETVADSGDVATYQALIALHASVTRDLVNRGLQLPSLVTYSMPRSLPSLVVSLRLYGDSLEADALVAQNKVIHPAFMPASGVALSA
jgi:prophage DNA circulation protein